jgi:hypothetical protein
MGNFANGLPMKIMTTLLAIIVILINIFFVTTTITESVDESTGWYIYLAIVVGCLGYTLFVGYLTVYLLITLGFEGLVHWKWVQKWYNVQEYLDEIAELLKQQKQ